MEDLRFYNVGCAEPRGLHRLVVPWRRLLRRILRPIFERQAEVFETMAVEIAALRDRYGELRGHLDALAQQQRELIDGLSQRLYGALAEEVSRDDKAMAALRTEVHAHQQAEFARYQRDLDRYISDCTAVVQRLTILDEHLDRLLGRTPRNAA
jgi:hypothetical protein